MTQKDLLVGQREELLKLDPAKINSVKTLRSYCEQYRRELVLVLAELENLNAVEVIPRTEEQDICMREIQKLNEASSHRALTLEETKRLDILVKNLYLSKEKNADSIDMKKIPKGVTPAQLMEIASGDE